MSSKLLLAAALSVLAADCRSLQQENVQLRLLAQSLGASSHALLQLLCLLGRRRGCLTPRPEQRVG